MTNTKINIARYLQVALWLGYFTVFYNLLEGLVSVFFGARGEALTLFGFGVDSFIEVISGIGIIVMVLRIRRNPDAPGTPFEGAALRVTGISFYILTAGLAVTAVYNIATGHTPETTLPGVIISLVSIFIMTALVVWKRRVGNALHSEPILEDAECSLVCIYMSLVLLAASLIFKLTGFGLVDSIGALGLIYFSFHEGRESFKKAKGIQSDEE
jgi:divalent metal cation (Fe/Co/Zn/Cd) transporter